MRERRVALWLLGVSALISPADRAGAHEGASEPEAVRGR